MPKYKNKKKLYTALTLFWSAALVGAAGLSYYLLNDKKENKHTVQILNTSYSTSYEPLSSYEVNLSISFSQQSDLMQWLKLEYWENNGTKTQTKYKDFYVDTLTKTVTITNLKPGTQYSYRIINNNGEELENNVHKTFSTFSKPSLSTTSFYDWIDVKMKTPTNNAFNNKNVLLIYKKYESQNDTVDFFQKSSSHPVTLLKLKNSDNISEYSIQERISNLEIGVPYVIALKVEGEATYLTDPVIIWTLGLNPETFVTKTYATTASGTLGGIYGATKTEFFVKYWKSSETIDSALVHEIKIGEKDVQVDYELKNLDPSTDYKYQLFQRNPDSSEKLVGAEKSFQTKSQPRVTTRPESGSAISLPVYKSSQKAIMSFGDFNNSSDPSEDLNVSDLRLVLTKKKPDGSFDFSDHPISYNLTPSEVNKNEYDVKLEDLKEKNVTYVGQIFELEDTNFRNGYLPEKIEFTIPENFDINVITAGNKRGTVVLSGINNIVANEAKISYWKKGDEENVKDIIINKINADNTFEVELPELVEKQEYLITVLPTYSKLNDIPKDAFIDPSIVNFTLGEDISTTISKVYSTVALGSMNNIEGYSTSDTQFVIKYWKASERLAEAKEFTPALNNDVYKIENLDPQTEYNYQLFKTITGSSQVAVGSVKSFKTFAQPKVVSKSNTQNNLSLNVWKTPTKALVSFNGFEAELDSDLSLNPQNLRLVVAKKPSSGNVDWANGGFISTFRNSSITGEYDVVLNNLERGAEYVAQIFDASDATFQNGYLASNLDIALPNNFDVAVNTAGNKRGLVVVSGINNVVNNEVKVLYWRKDDPSNKTEVLIDDVTKNFELNLSSLQDDVEYELAIVSTFGNLQNTSTDHFTQNPLVWFTLGKDVSNVIDKAYSKTALGSLSGLEGYAADTEFVIKYWKSSQTVSEAKTYKPNIIGLTELDYTLENLDPATEYKYQLFKKVGGGSEEAVGAEKSFKTIVQPQILGQTGTTGLSLNVWKTPSKAIMSFANLTNSDASMSLNLANIKLVVAKKKADGTFDWQTAATSFNITQSSVAEQWEATLNGLDKNAQYVAQIFETGDTKYQYGYLENPVDFAMPNNFNVNVITSGNQRGTVVIENISNVVANEVQISYWRKNSKNTKDTVKLTPVSGSNRLEIKLNDLENEVEYELAIVTTLAKLQDVDQDSFTIPGITSFTLSRDVDTSVTKAYSSAAIATLNNFADYVSQGTEFIIKYWKQSENISDAREFKPSLNTGDPVTFTLANLDSATDYKYQLFKKVGSSPEEAVGSIKDFKTLVRPTVENVTNSEGLSLNVWKTPSKAIMNLQNLTNSSDSAKNVDLSKLKLYVIKHPGSGVTPNWSSKVKELTFNTASLTPSGSYEVTLENLPDKNAKYMVQLFDEADTRFEYGFLQTPVEFGIPNNFGASVVSSGNQRGKITISGINNVVDKELVILYQQKNDATKNGKITVNGINTTTNSFETMLNLSDIQEDVEYELVVLSSNTKLQSFPADSFTTPEKTSFTISGDVNTSITQSYTKTALGSLNNLGGYSADSTDFIVKYWKSEETIERAQQFKPTTYSGSSLAYKLTNLDSNTTYKYQLFKKVGDAAEEKVGAEKTFKTKVQPAIVEKTGATGLSLNVWKTPSKALVSFNNFSNSSDNEKSFDPSKLKVYVIKHPGEGSALNWLTKVKEITLSDISPSASGEYEVSLSELPEKNVKYMVQIFDETDTGFEYGLLESPVEFYIPNALTASVTTSGNKRGTVTINGINNVVNNELKIVYWPKDDSTNKNEVVINNINGSSFETKLLALVDEKDYELAVVPNYSPLETTPQNSYINPDILSFSLSRDVNTLVTKAYSKAAIGNINNLGDYSSSTTEFIIKYWKSSEDVSRASEFKTSSYSGDSLNYQLLNLEEATTYNYQLFKVVDGGSEESVGAVKTFKTQVQPTVASKANAESSLSLNVWKTPSKAIISFNNFNHATDSEMSLNASQLKLYVVKTPTSGTTIDWSSKVKEVSFGSSTTPGEFEVILDGLDKGAKYSVQIFDVNDTSFEYGYLEAPVEFTMPNDFTANAITSGNKRGTIVVSGINNVVDKELKVVYWVKGDESNANEVVINPIETSSNTFELKVAWLEDGKEYEFVVLSTYGKLQVKPTDSFINPQKGSFTLSTDVNTTVNRTYAKVALGTINNLDGYVQDSTKFIIKYVKSSEDWASSSVEEIQINTYSGSSFSYEIANLEAASEYKYRLYKVVDGVQETVGLEKTFKTKVQPAVADYANTDNGLSLKVWKTPTKALIALDSFTNADTAKTLNTTNLRLAVAKKKSDGSPDWENKVDFVSLVENDLITGQYKAFINSLEKNTEYVAQLFESDDTNYKYGYLNSPFEFSTPDEFEAEIALKGDKRGVVTVGNINNVVNKEVRLAYWLKSNPSDIQYANISLPADDTNSVEVKLENLESNQEYEFTILSTIADFQNISTDAFIATKQFTLPSDAEVTIIKSYSTTASGTINNLDGYTSATNQFFVKYWKSSEEKSSATELMVSYTDTSASFELESLDPETEYRYVLVKRLVSDSGVEEEMGAEKTFKTKLRPQIVNKSNSNSVSLPVWKSPSKALLTFNNLVKASDTLASLDPTQLRVYVIKKPEGSAALDWATASISSSLSASSVEGEYDAMINGSLEKGATYIAQIFELTDTSFANPYLENNTEFTIPNNFAVTTAIASRGKVDVTVSNINNVVNNELKIVYWRKDDEAHKNTVLVPVSDGTTTFTTQLTGLDDNASYQLAVLSTYDNLQNIKTDLFIDSVVEFTNPVHLKASTISVSNGLLNYNLTDLVPSQNLHNVQLLLQWRLKSTSSASSTEWEDATSSNSFGFTIPSSHTSEDYTIQVPLEKLSGTSKTLFRGDQYEWRIIKEADATDHTANEVKVNPELSNTLSDALYNLGSKLTKVANSTNWVQWKDINVDNIATWTSGQAADALVQVVGSPLTTKKQWWDFYEYLAHAAPEEVKEKFKTKLMNAVALLSPNSESLTTLRWKVLPMSAGTWDDSWTTIWNSQIRDSIAIGGFDPNSNTSDRPIKPSDFMGSNWKFSSLEAIGKALEYKLQRIKNVHKISPDNMFVTNFTPSAKDQTYASSLVNLTQIKEMYQLPESTNIFGSTYTLTPLENTDTEKNILSNDEEGRIYIKVRARKGGDASSDIFYWTYIDGFKTVNPSTEPIASDVTITRRLDSIDTALVINEMYKAASSSEAKKAVVLKHFDIKVNSPAFDYDILEMNFDISDQNSLKIKLRLNPKTYNVATPRDKEATKTPTVSALENEFTISVPRKIEQPSSMTILNTLTVGGSDIAQIGSLTESSINYRGAVLLNQSYNRLNAIFRDAYFAKQVHSDSTSYNALVTKLSTLVNGMSFTETNRRLYLRAGLQNAFTTIPSTLTGTFNVSTYNGKTFEFWASDSALNTNNNTARENLVKNIIDKYGKIIS